MAADIFAVKRDDPIGAAAEDTGRLILLEHDTAFINKDLKRIFFIDVERPAKFDRQNDAAKFIDFADNSSRFQYNCLPKKFLLLFQPRVQFTLLSIFCQGHISPRLRIFFGISLYRPE